MFLDGFVVRLRDYGVPVSMTDVLDFYRGMEKGLAPDLESLFLFARLCFVRRVEHMDPFERAFAFHFHGIDLPRVAKGDPELLNTPQFQEWLSKTIDGGELPPTALWEFTPEELMRRFWETLEKQTKEHHGGSRWIGTGGNSPFGHSGNARGGVRVGGGSGHRSALKVIGERRYIDYADQTTLKGENLGQALSALKKMVPEGPADELDLPGTIERSAKNGGEIDLVFSRGMNDRLEVVLLLDNGGTSMFPFVSLTRMLFAKMRGRIKRLTTYFFHNTIYGAVFKDARRLKPHPTEELLRLSPETRLLFVGDASMAPAELLYPHGAISWGIDDRESSLVWLERLRDRFRRSVWLNPIVKEDWPRAYGRTTIQRIGQVFPMEDLTLGGIKRAVERLNRG